MTSPADVDSLLRRMRELAAVEVESIAPDGEPSLIALFRDDILDALGEARRRRNELAKALASDPAPVLEAPLSKRITAAPQAVATADKWRARAADARLLARIDEVAGQLFPKLAALDGRLG